MLDERIDVFRILFVETLKFQFVDNISASQAVAGRERRVFRAANRREVCSDRLEGVWCPRSAHPPKGRERGMAACGLRLGCRSLPARPCVGLLQAGALFPSVRKKLSCCDVLFSPIHALQGVRRWPCCFSLLPDVTRRRVQNVRSVQVLYVPYRYILRYVMN